MAAKKEVACYIKTKNWLHQRRRSSLKLIIIWGRSSQKLKLIIKKYNNLLDTFFDYIISRNKQSFDYANQQK